SVKLLEASYKCERTFISGGIFRSAINTRYEGCFTITSTVSNSFVNKILSASAPPPNTLGDHRRCNPVSDFKRYFFFEMVKDWGYVLFKRPFNLNPLEFF